MPRSGVTGFPAQHRAEQRQRRADRAVFGFVPPRYPYTQPWAFMASATLRKPAIFAPAM